jgi:hypothetical protein
MNYLEEFKRRCKEIEEKELSAKTKLKRILDLESVGSYQIVKYDGNDRYPIAWNLTLNEAERFLKLLHEKLLRTNKPNNIGIPYFKLERYKINFEGSKNV